MDKMLSVVLPAYNEEQMIKKTAQVVGDLLEKEQIPYELVFVNDGSKDHTWEKILELKEERAHIKGVCFSRNFGKEAGIYAGLEHANGDYVAIMDVDLQDPPHLLPEMYGHIKAGFDSVATRRVSRKGEPPIRSFFARAFYKIMHKISKTEIVDGARDYRLITKQVADAILSLGEYNRFTKGIFGWVGYKTKWLEYENIERTRGETKWSFWKLFLYSIDGMIAFSTVPLAISSFFGIVFCFLAFLLIIVTIVRKAVYGDPVSGWPSLVCIISLVGGVQMFCVGILGQYMSKTYMEVKKRPIYLVKEEL